MLESVRPAISTPSRSRIPPNRCAVASAIARCPAAPVLIRVPSISQRRRRGFFIDDFRWADCRIEWRLSEPLRSAHANLKFDNLKSEIPYRGRIAPSPTGYLHLGHAMTFWRAQERAQNARRKARFSESKIWIATGAGRNFATRSSKTFAGLDCDGTKGRILAVRLRPTSKVNGAKSIWRFGRNCATRR